MREVDYEEGCCICGNTDVSLQGNWCQECTEWERTADIEGYEERKRERIAEENEY